jgi:hypothetical protein
MEQVDGGSADHFLGLIPQVPELRRVREQDASPVVADGDEVERLLDDRAVTTVLVAFGNVRDRLPGAWLTHLLYLGIAVHGPETRCWTERRT